MAFTVNILTVNAHDTNKAFFKINQKDDTVIVNAEFPWTLRNAIFKAYPELKKSKSQEVFNSLIFKYIDNNFKIFDKKEIPLILLKVEFIKNSQGHSHQNDYQFIFKGNSFFKVKNTLMFNFKETQKNYNKINLNNKEITFITTKNKNSFTLESAPNTHNYTWVYICLFLILVILVFILIDRNKVV